MQSLGAPPPPAPEDAPPSTAIIPYQSTPQQNAVAAFDDVIAVRADSMRIQNLSAHALDNYSVCRIINYRIGGICWTALFEIAKGAYINK